MKANELRIGNLVTIDNPKHHPSIKGKPLIVLAIDEIDEPKCSLICTDPKENLIIPAYSQFLKFIQPIPLTAEWLEKFGFRTSRPKLLFLPIPKHKMEIHYEMQPYGNVVTLQSDFGMLIPNDIEHVHQLQNLFFALTGEELTIREDAK